MERYVQETTYLRTKKITSQNPMHGRVETSCTTGSSSSWLCSVWRAAQLASAAAALLAQGRVHFGLQVVILVRDQQQERDQQQDRKDMMIDVAYLFLFKCFSSNSHFSHFPLLLYCTTPQKNFYYIHSVISSKLFSFNFLPFWLRTVFCKEFNHQKSSKIL